MIQYPPAPEGTMVREPKARPYRTDRMKRDIECITKPTGSHRAQGRSEQSFTCAGSIANRRRRGHFVRAFQQNRLRRDRGFFLSRRWNCWKRRRRWRRWVSPIFPATGLPGMAACEEMPEPAIHTSPSLDLRWAGTRPPA